MKTIHRPILIISALILLLGLVACSQDGGPGDTVALQTDGPDKSYEESQQHLEWLDGQRTEDTPLLYEYEDAIRATINVANGGVVSGKPASWPEGYTFHYLIYPNSVDLSEAEDENEVLYGTGAEEFELVVQVPVFDTQFSCPNAVMPIQLYPHKLRYTNWIDENGGVHEFRGELTVNYHPNLDPDCAKGFEMYSADGDPAGGYFVEEAFQAFSSPDVLDKGLKPGGGGGGGGIDPIVENCRMNIQVGVRHHSTWALVEDTDTEPPVIPFNPVSPCADQN